ncbi:MurR/RpiR family transcriptional regulator [Paenibacillus sp. GD4]|jgi:DNA-binding MurR/RpiR family transcriptional regulator|uniref:MurR/RpiR family transcriptional regulator n=1 Tax=Paenibacillus sp. GD4 TaxID=3068890 RepID=UPI002796B61E|nr:MurR/RpiR family transcriptional regulator [Paenibacillus sp. GD4]MDQ1913520.1 MurR/RpiR family transcriptional regulator [Paenibacillus sp. GD4]
MSLQSTGSKAILWIESNYNFLTKTEKKVADVVLQEKEKVVYSSVTDLAEMADTGETTVLRFCRKLGFRGFQEFKLAVAQDLASSVEEVHGLPKKGDTIADIALKITATNTQALKDTMGLLQHQELEKAVDALVTKKKIHFFGVGSSGFTALDAHYRFMRLGFQVNSAIDAHLIAMSCALAGPDDVVVGISTSGSTKDLVDAISLAAANGATIICLTNHARSPITQYAHAILLAASKETPLQGGAFSSKLAQIHLLDILSTAVALKHSETTAAAIEKTAKAVIDKLY